MPETFFISDLHLGHDRMYTVPFLREDGVTPMRPFSCAEEADEYMIEQWNSVVTKRDFVYVLGDIAFGLEALEKVARMNGLKMLVGGNHDQLSTYTYLKYFTKVVGLRYLKKDRIILSHAPVHPEAFNDGRFVLNAHGHLHHQVVKNDGRYLNVSVELMNYRPISLNSIRKAISVS